MASGGTPGDGWAGPLTGINGFSASYDRQRWQLHLHVELWSCPRCCQRMFSSFTIGAPAAQLVASETEVLVGRGVILNWESTVGPCVKTHDWANPHEFGSRGADVIVVNEVGTRTYGIQCGTANVVSNTTQVRFKGDANGNDIRQPAAGLGQQVSDTDLVVRECGELPCPWHRTSRLEW